VTVSVTVAALLSLVFGTLPVGAAAPTPARTARVYVLTPSSEPDEITGPSTLKVYDPQTARLLRTVPLRGAKPHHLYVLPRSHLALISHFAPTAFVEVLDLSTDQIVGTIPTGTGPRHLAFSPDHRFAYSANLEDNSISVIDLARRITVRTIPVGKKPNYVVSVRTARGQRLFVANYGEATLTVLDARTLTPVGSVAVGANPFNIVATHDGRTLVSANAGANTVSFVDTATLAVEADVPIGGRHDPAVKQRLNPRISPDGRWLLVGNQDASAISVIDLARRRLAELLPAGRGADIAFFPPRGPAHGDIIATNRYDTFLTVARLRGSRPPQFVRNVALRVPGSHYLTYDSQWRRAFIAERSGGAFSVVDLHRLRETSNTAVGPGPDQATYVFFERDRAQVNTER
jgi:YVTN family beta-propeller protein